MSLASITGAKRLGVAALVLAALATPAAAAAPQFPEPPVALPTPLLSIGSRAPEAPAAIHVAQSREAAQLALRIQQLEEQIRVLTGQVEGLQFQLTQMQTLIEKQNEDNEFRFQQLEGGAPKKPQAATESGGAMPTEGLPQDVTGHDLAIDEPLVDNPEGMPMDSLGESQDPLVGQGGGQGSLTLPTGDGELANLGGGRPLDLTLGGGQAPIDGDAEAQFAAGYDAIVRGDYAFAEEQFRQFIALYPQNPHAPDAFNWLGEALIQRGAFDEAADVLLTGFQDYPDSQSAPDILLKLGVALAGAGETDTACRTFAEVQKRYPNMAPAFSSRLAEEKARAQCPV